MNFWDSIKSFFSNLGHTILAEIITALPEAQQIIMQTITAIVDAAILYVENKYSGHLVTLKAGEPMTPAQKLILDTARHNDAFNYVKDKIAEMPAAYPAIPDSLIHLYIEITVQKSKRVSEGNGGNFPGGNSNA